MSTMQAINRLFELVSFSLGTSPTQEVMREELEQIGKIHKDTESSELHYLLGIGWRNYTAWFIRGDDRKEYFEKSIKYLKNAYLMEKTPDRIKYGKVLGQLYVDEAIVRNLNQGKALLVELYKSTNDYDPALCSLIQAYYASGDYLKAAKIAYYIHKRACQSEEWKDCVPPAPLTMAAKACRAEIKNLKKSGNNNRAWEVSKKLIENVHCSDNDRKIHLQLTKRIKESNKE